MIRRDQSRCCPLCDGPNDCQLCTVAAYKGPCWCAKVKIPDELIAQVPAESRNKALHLPGLRDEISSQHKADGMAYTKNLARRFLF